MKKTWRPSRITQTKEVSQKSFVIVIAAMTFRGNQEYLYIKQDSQKAVRTSETSRQLIYPFYLSDGQGLTKVVCQSSHIKESKNKHAIALGKANSESY